MKENEINIKPIGNIRVEGDDPMKAEFYLDIHEQYRSALKALKDLQPKGPCRRAAIKIRKKRRIKTRGFA